jgi:hypothetical protein
MCRRLSLLAIDIFSPTFAPMFALNVSFSQQKWVTMGVEIGG